MEFKTYKIGLYDSITKKRVDTVYIQKREDEKIVQACKRYMIETYGGVAWSEDYDYPEKPGSFLRYVFSMNVNLFLAYSLTNKTEQKKRTIADIASDIESLWGSKIYFGARPYLDAMHKIESIDEMYHSDPAYHIINYFLANATTWRGEHARRIKAELNQLIKQHKTI